MSSNKTRGVKVDFEALSRYGIDSNRKILTKKAIKANQIKPKCLDKLLETDKYGYWSDPAGEIFLSDFSSDMGSPDRKTSRPRSNESASEDEQENKTITNESDHEMSPEANDIDNDIDGDESKNTTPVQDAS